MKTIVSRFIILAIAGLSIMTMIVLGAPKKKLNNTEAKFEEIYTILTKMNEYENSRTWNQTLSLFVISLNLCLCFLMILLVSVL